MAARTLDRWFGTTGIALGVWLVLAVTIAVAETAPAWRGEGGSGPWSWEQHFDPPRKVAVLRQALGTHDFVLRDAPRDYVWEFTEDGARWHAFPSGQVATERRLVREFRFPRPRVLRGLRLSVRAATGASPAVGKLELLPESPQEALPWILVANSTHDATLPGHGQEFIPLARSCPGRESLVAQQIWIPDLDPALVEIEPRPLAIFLSGSFKDWCEVDRSHWRGAEKILKRGHDPIWASCGGAQALAILADTGTRRPWDCPHCRDPRNPRVPIYTHIGHMGIGPHACGDYADCIFERGPQTVRRLTNDPVFEGLPETFTVMESHCGQIEYPPRGWEWIATATGTNRTRIQAIHLRGRPVYAAQFHIEMSGTPETSRTIMANFLAMAASYAASRH